MSMDQLRLAHCTRIYPPRVCFVLSNEREGVVKFNFRGSGPEQSYEVIPKRVASKRYKLSNKISLPLVLL